ncbi:MAG: hypothetical protein LUH05_01740 [Candidatus Gastranaerophilales bacterium]|nr:hypothetical protein [Candidatus Gastranaerophilales bacterium]
MFKFIIDIFCKDTVIGLSEFNDSIKKENYDKKFSKLFGSKENDLNINSMFIGPCVYRL